MLPLFHDALIVCVLASGSKGNCTYIGNGRHGVLIDCGISARQVLLRLDAVGLADAPIDAVLVTHEHSDHVGGARVLFNRLEKTRGRRVPFYMTAGTLRALSERRRPAEAHPIRPGHTLPVGSLTVEAFTVPHDTRDPVGYAVDAGGARAGVITDLGRSTRLVERTLASLDAAVVEFNHDTEMLLDGPYPWRLKQRIRSHHGHLSNHQAHQLLARAARPGVLKHVILGHLSEENNRPEKAWEAAEAALHTAKRRDVAVHLAHQVEPCGPLEVPVAPPEPSTASPTRSRAASRSSGADDSAHQIGLFGG